MPCQGHKGHHQAHFMNSDASPRMLRLMGSSVSLGFFRGDCMKIDDSDQTDESFRRHGKLSSYSTSMPSSSSSFSSESPSCSFCSLRRFCSRNTRLHVLREAAVMWCDIPAAATRQLRPEQLTATAILKSARNQVAKRLCAPETGHIALPRCCRM